jgi:hypothetical protein
MGAELTAADYAFLIVLKAEGRELSNNDMDELYGIRLVGPFLARMINEGWVVSDKKSRPFRHVITDDGTEALAEPLTMDQDRVPKGEKRAPGERQLFWAAMVAQQKLLLSIPAKVTAKAKAPEIANGATRVDLDGRIRAAYTDLAGAPGEWVNLVALRGHLADVSKTDLDRALERLMDESDVRLDPEPFNHRVGPEEKQAAIHIGGEDRHKLAIGRR